MSILLKSGKAVQKKLNPTNEKTKKHQNINKKKKKETHKQIDS